MKASNQARSLQVEISKACRSTAYRHAFREKGISDDHANKRKKVLKRMCVVLVDQCGFKVKTIKNIKTKHIRSYAEYLHLNGISPRSIINNLSILRVFFHRVLARPGVVPPVKKLFPGDDRFNTKVATKVDKGWRSNGIEFKCVYERIYNKDPNVAAQILLCAAFGLRRREAICFRPGECIYDNYIEVVYGPKNGRMRRVYIINDIQRAVLEYVKPFVSRSYGSTIPDGYTLRQWKSHFDYIIREYGYLTRKKSGVTVHGLRHQYLGDLYELITGFPPPIRGHQISQIDEKVLDRIGRSIVTDQAGHSRMNIPAAYLGETPGRVRQRRIDEFKQKYGK